MAGGKHRRNIKLDNDAEALLGRVGNASEYLSRTIMRRSMQWTAALELMRAAGWSSSQLVVGCEALNGYWLAGKAVHGNYLADVLAEGLSEAEFKSTGWRVRLKTLEADPGQATALAILVDEFWSGNEACRAAVQD